MPKTPSMQTVRSILPTRLRNARFSTIRKAPRFARYFALGDDPKTTRSVLRQLYESAALPPIEQRVVRTTLRTAANNRGELQPADVSEASTARVARQLRTESQNQARLKRSNVRAENAFFN